MTESLMITATAMELINISHPENENHYLAIIDGVDHALAQKLEALLHKHPTYDAAICEARTVLRAAGVDRIRVWNDPDHDLHSTIYRTYLRVPKSAKTMAFIAA